MKRLGLLLLFSLAACSRISLESARYTCSPGGSGDQCPGGWRCISEGFCADPDAGAPWKCMSSTDCTGGWQCLADGTCANPTVGGAWRCNDSTQCTAQWRCINDKLCADPDAGGAWSCSTSTDCTGGWHCGANDRCYDVTTAGNIICRADAGDCAPGWVCGLEGRCLDSTVPNGNLCMSDPDCFAGQRCAAGRCLDVQHDALRPSTGTLTLTPNAQPFANAKLLSAWEDGRRVVAGVVNDELVWLITEPVGTLDGGEGPQRRPLQPVDPRELAVVYENLDLDAVLLQGDGGLLIAPLDGRALTTQNAPFPLTGMRATYLKAQPLVVFGPQGVGAGMPSSLRYVPPPSGLGTPRDAVLNRERLVVAGSGGVFVRRFTMSGFDDAGWRPTKLCDGKTGDLLDAFALRSAYGPFVSNRLTVVVRVDAGTRVVHFEPAAGPMVPCAFDVDTLTSLAPVVGDELYPNVVTPVAYLGDGHGSSADGVAGYDALNAGVITTDAGTYAATRFGRTNTGGLVAALAGEQVRVENSETPWLIPVTPPGAASRSLTSTASLVTLPSSSASIVLGMTDQTCFSRRDAAWCSHFGMATSQLLPVRGSNDWVSTVSMDQKVATLLDLTGLPAVTEYPAPVGLRQAPAATVARDGGVALVVTAVDDYLVWAEGQPNNGRNPVTSQVAVSPLPRGVVTDVVLTDRTPTPDARFAEGWALAAGRVFRVYASTPALWRSQEIVLPTEVEVLRLWLDGPRPRAGDKRGVVYGLDSAVALSEPLLLGDNVSQYGSWCEHVFAVSTTGRLYRLIAGPTVLGRWEPLPTTAFIRSLSDEGGVLRAFDEQGRTHFFDGLSCGAN